MMDDVVKDDVPMSSVNWSSHKQEYNLNRKLSNRNRNVSISIPVATSTELTSHSKENFKHHKRQCGDNDNEAQNNSRVHHEVYHHLYAYRGASRWVREKLSLLKLFAFGVMNPHAKVLQKWNQFVIISCLFAIFLDPVFVYLMSVDKERKCIAINWRTAKFIVTMRSMTDFIYFMHMLHQFRLAYVKRGGDLVDQTRRIALHYLSGYFFLDLFIVLPLPQIIVVFILPSSIAPSGAKGAQILLQSAILVQYILKLCRFQLLAGWSPTNSAVESTWANFGINLLTFVFAAHVVGSCWYLFGLQRVKQCLRGTCHESGFVNCKKFIVCGHGNDFGSFKVDPTWNNWKQNVNSSACFDEDGFPYGIYVKVVNLAAENSIITRCIYSFFWGFQQIGTLAGNLTPSFFLWEVLFTMAITGLGLLLFPLLIGNMFNILQRRHEKSLRQRAVQWWMDERHLPEELQRRVLEVERYKLAAAQKVDEEMLMDNLPDDLQRDIRRHCFGFLKRVRIFAVMDDAVLDAICEKLRRKTYIEGGRILYEGEIVTKMIFIVRGQMESAQLGYKVTLYEGDVCGEELLQWCFDQSSFLGDIRKERKGHKLVSQRTLTCLRNVEAYVIQAEDLQEVITLFARFFSNHRIQMAIKNESRYWRGRAATTIQLSWRYRKKRQSRAATSHSGTTLSSNYK